MDFLFAFSVPVNDCCADATLNRYEEKKNNWTHAISSIYTSGASYTVKPIELATACITGERGSRTYSMSGRQIRQTKKNKTI